MSLGEWILSFFGVVLIVFFIVIIVKESENYKNVKIIKQEPTAKTPNVQFFTAKVIKKRVHVYYVSEINIPISETQYWITFLLEERKEQEFLVPKELFERIEEGQEGTLVTTNGNFFDFGDGEDIEDDEED